MQREQVDGANLCEGIMEVAFEQWTERVSAYMPVTSVDFNVFPTLQGSGIKCTFCTGRVQREFSEFRWYHE